MTIGFGFWVCDIDDKIMDEDYLKTQNYDEIHALDLEDIDQYGSQLIIVGCVITFCSIFGLIASYFGIVGRDFNILKKRRIIHF